MFGDESFEVEVDRMKQNLKRFRRENTDLKKQLVLYLSICFLVSVFSCSMMIYLIFSNSPRVNIIMSDGYEVENQDIQIDESLEEEIYTEEDGVISSSLDTEELSLGSIDEIEEEDFSIEIDSRATPEKVIESEVSFGLPAAKAEAFGLPNSSNRKTTTIKRYIVKKNDNLWNIARKHFGSSRYIQKIKKDNSLISDDLIPGTRLILMVEE